MTSNDEKTDQVTPDRFEYREYPGWVKFSLLGFPCRAAQWFFFALSLAAALGLLIYGQWNPRAFYGSIVAIMAALMYWLTIRWVDRHGTW